MAWSELGCDLSDRSERPGLECHFMSTRIAKTRISVGMEGDGVSALMSASHIIQLVGGDVIRAYQTSGGEKANGGVWKCAGKPREGRCP